MVMWLCEIGEFIYYILDLSSMLGSYLPISVYKIHINITIGTFFVSGPNG